MEQFKVIREIGKGGYGRALLVQSIANQELRVVKEMNLAKMSPQARESALSEANILSSLKHTNIIRYRGCTHQKKMLYILMDYADGGDLGKIIANKKRGSFPEEQILDWFVQICLAIKYLHDRKIMHRDLKPQNVFLSSGDIVKLGDFGISKAFDHTGDMAKTAIGTPLYCSPEICLGHKYNEKSDIWSLGCILYELASLRRPFMGTNIGEIMRKIMTNNPRPIPSQYSPEFRELINMMLKKNPNERASIYDILQLPLIRNKAIALLGKTQARSELSHQVFHGVKAGETPADVPDEINLPFVSHQEKETQETKKKEENNPNPQNDKESIASKERKSQEKLRKALQSMADNLKEVINGHFDLSAINEAQEEMNEGDFYFMGRKLVLNTVQNSDPLAYKLESVRSFLEEMLGMEKFKEIYKVASEGKSTQLLKLTQSDAYVFQLVLQLVSYESQM